MPFAPRAPSKYGVPGIAAVIRSCGLTYQQVADANGISRIYLCYLVLGQRRPSLTLAQRLACWAGMTVDDAWAADRG